ncbi:MAG: CheR family methyltransferase [Thermodesulfobacteriota bacterium]
MAFTYFFRDRQTLEVIRDYALPMLRSRRYIHIWDAGCAMGPEPYSLAIILCENMGSMLFRNLTIHATDVDESNQFEEVIRKGVYRRDQIKSVPQHVFERYFETNGDEGSVRIKKEIRDRVNFTRHDLLGLNPVRKDLSLIMCKNVLLHFHPEQRIEVIKMFHNCLHDEGFFVTEQTQQLPAEVEHLFEPVVSHVKLYRKKAKD